MIVIACSWGKEPFLGDDDPPLPENLLNLAKAQGEPMVQPDAVTEEFTRESVAVVPIYIRFRYASAQKPGSSWRYL